MSLIQDISRLCAAFVGIVQSIYVTICLFIGIEGFILNPEDIKEHEPSCENFDMQLLQFAWLELVPLFSKLETLHNDIKSLQGLGSDCRNNGISLSAAQTTRVAKLCDLVDSIPIVHFPTHLFPESTNLPSSSLIIPTNLPDREQLGLYLQKLKIRLRNVDEMASSKKNENIRFKSAQKDSSRFKQIYDLNVIRLSVRDLLNEVDSIESLYEQYHQPLSYFAKLKQVIHQPMQDLVLASSEIPDVKPLEDQLEKDMKTLRVVKEQYDLCRSEKSLVKLTHDRKDMIAIEEKIRDLFKSEANRHKIVLFDGQVDRSDLSEDMQGVLEDFLRDKEDNYRTLFNCDDVVAKIVLDWVVERQKAERVEHPTADFLDIELVRAYWLDWKDRANYIEDYIRSEECAKCYSSLRESRKRLYRCQRGFQMNLEQFCKATERYIKVGDRAEVLKLQCKKLYLSEFYRSQSMTPKT